MTKKRSKRSKKAKVRKHKAGRKPSKDIANPILEKLEMIEKRMATITDLEALNKNVATYLSKAAKSFPRFDARDFESHISNLEKHTQDLEKMIQSSSGDERMAKYLKAVTSYMKEVTKIEAKLVERQDAIHANLEEIKQMLAGNK